MTKWQQLTASGTLCFSGAYNRVLQHICSAAPVLICFDPWYPKIDEERMPFGFEFARSKQRNVIAVKSLMNDWYQNEEFASALTTITEIAGARRRIGYGSSMGAYAAINFARALKLDYVILFSPQASIDPAKCPFEGRYRHEAAQITFRHDDLSAGAEIPGVLLFDPRCGADREHANIICNTHPIEKVETPFFGHQTLNIFGASGILGNLILDILDEGVDKRKLIESRRAIRSKASEYFIELTNAALTSKRLSLARECINRAAVLDGDQIRIAHTLATIDYVGGARRAAIARWQELLERGNDVPRVWWLIGQTALKYNFIELKKACQNQDLSLGVNS